MVLVANWNLAKIDGRCHALKIHKISMHAHGKILLISPIFLQIVMPFMYLQIYTRVFDYILGIDNRYFLLFDQPEP